MSTITARHRRSFAVGLIAMAGMLVVYTLLLFWLGGTWRHPLEQFARSWYWMAVIVLGFGVQVGLWRYLALGRTAGSGAAASVSGGTGGLAMAACCVHHLADVLPLAGVTVAATVLTRYQTALFAVAVASNVAGIAWLCRRLSQAAPSAAGRLPHYAMPLPYFTRPAIAAMTGGLAAAVFFWLVSVRPAETPAATAAPPAADPLAAVTNPPAEVAGTVALLPTQLDSQAEVEVSATPTVLDQSGVTFAITLNTHSVDLDYDFASISTLVADGQRLAALRWEGERGGHHLQGKLVFPPLPQQSRTLQLVLFGVGGVDRTLTWQLTP